MVEFNIEDLMSKDKKKIKEKTSPGRKTGTKIKEESSNASLTVALTPTQKEDLLKYADDESRSAGEIIKLVLIEKGIIKKNKTVKGS